MTERTPSILIIDNDEGLVAAISARLESYGYACIRAGTGAQGLAMFQENRPDLVITDLNMPEGNGIALALKLRESNMVPIIVVTGFHDNFKRDLRGIERVTVLKKPFDAEQLIDLIETELATSGCRLPMGNSHRRKRRPHSKETSNAM